MISTDELSKVRELMMSVCLACECIVQLFFVTLSPSFGITSILRGQNHNWQSCLRIGLQVRYIVCREEIFGVRLRSADF